MKSPAILLLFVFGILLGSAGTFLVTDVKSQPTANPSPASTIPEGWREVVVPYNDTLSLVFQVRETDELARLKYEEQIIGYKVVDQYAPQLGAGVDIITTRIEEFYDLPNATSIAEYKENREGFTIDQFREATIAGRPTVKQVYTASLGQKRADGAIIKRPQKNLLRYVIEGQDHQFVILKANILAQTYLDRVALSLRLVPKTSVQETSEVNLDVTGTDSTDLQPTESIDLFNGTSGIGL